MFNTLQYLVFIPLFPIQTPANVSYFFSTLITFLVFDILTPLHINVWVNQINNYQGDPMYPEFGDLGFNSVYLIENMGSSFLSFIILPALVLLTLALKPLVRFQTRAKIGPKEDS